MNFTETILRTFGKTKFWFKKNSPELLIASGIICSAGAIASAVFGTIELPKVINKNKNQITQIKKNLKDDNAILNNKIDVAEEKKKLRIEYTKTVGKTLLVYAPSVLLFATSVSCILGSHRIIKGRNLALAAAYTALDNSFKEYRKRVKNELGEEKENDIFEGLTNKKIQIEENGKKKTVVKKVREDRSCDPLSVFFDELTPEYTDDININLDFLTCQERSLTQKLRINGYLFLEDVYEALGLLDRNYVLNDEQMMAMKTVGWLYDPDGDEYDNYVSFGIRDPRTGNLMPNIVEQKRYNEPGIHLTFNHDGNILTKFVNNKKELIRKRNAR